MDSKADDQPMYARLKRDGKMQLLTVARRKDGRVRRTTEDD
jgi:hypothetical protein